MPKLYTQEEVDKLIAEKLSSVRTKDLTDDEYGTIPNTKAVRSVIAADREKNK